jgi:hypothetical protein
LADAHFWCFQTSTELQRQSKIFTREKVSDTWNVSVKTECHLNSAVNLDELCVFTDHGLETEGVSLAANFCVRRI